MNTIIIYFLYNFIINYIYNIIIAYNYICVLRKQPRLCAANALRLCPEYLLHNLQQNPTFLHLFTFTTW